MNNIIALVQGAIMGGDALTVVAIWTNKQSYKFWYVVWY